jgi:hypothetical protein
VGYGRRKREISGIPPDPNKVYEVSMTTFIKVDYKNEMAREKGKTIKSLGVAESVVINDFLWNFLVLLLYRNIRIKRLMINNTNIRVSKYTCK